MQTGFEGLIGQGHVVELLNQAIAHNRIAPGYLFAGPNGIGKRLAAECFITQLLHSSNDGAEDEVEKLTQLRHRIQERNHPDLLWVEPTYMHQGKRLSIAEAEEKKLKRRAPPILRLEQIREIAEFLSRPPLEASRAVVVLDQADTMAEAAANALLKTLEEPGQATLILIAPKEDSLLPTLISRCQTIAFRRLNSEAIAHILHHNGHGEILNHPNILKLAQGSPGEAIASWHQLQALQEKAPTLLRALEHPPTSLRQALTLAQAIAKELDAERQLWLIGYLQHCYWRDGYGPDIGPDNGQSTNQPHHPPPMYLDILETARRQLLRYVQPRLVWEVSLMKMVS
ncbi:MAG: DNA polymerase III subunit delta' [Cyanobacteria bacterium P01_F01_bin.150]